MNKVEKIKAEIERRLRTIEPNLPSREEFDKVADRNPGINSDFNIGEKMGAYTMLKKVEQFIDSLEEEPVSEDLEEAACEYDNSHIDDNNLAFKAGAEWQKEKMMEDAVDGEIYFSLDYQQYRINTEPLAYFHHGDKVKLIIVKEE